MYSKIPFVLKTTELVWVESSIRFHHIFLRVELRVDQVYFSVTSSFYVGLHFGLQ